MSYEPVDMNPYNELLYEPVDMNPYNDLWASRHGSYNNLWVSGHGLYINPWVSGHGSYNDPIAKTIMALPGSVLAILIMSSACVDSFSNSCRICDFLSMSEDIWRASNTVTLTFINWLEKWSRPWKYRTRASSRSEPETKLKVVGYTGLHPQNLH